MPGNNRNLEGQKQFGKRIQNDDFVHRRFTDDEFEQLEREFKNVDDNFFRTTPFEEWN